MWPAAPAPSASAPVTTNAAVRTQILIAQAPAHLKSLFTLNIPLLPTITSRTQLVRSGALYRWDLTEGGKDVVMEAGGTAIVTDSLAAIDLALAGVGLAYMFEPLARADLVAGRLVQVLPQSAIEEPGLFLYFPRRAAMAPKLRAFIDTAQEIGRTSLRTSGRKTLSE